MANTKNCVTSPFQGLGTSDSPRASVLEIFVCVCMYAFIYRARGVWKMQHTFTQISVMHKDKSKMSITEVRLVDIFSL